MGWLVLFVVLCLAAVALSLTGPRDRRRRANRGYGRHSTWWSGDGGAGGGYDGGGCDSGGGFDGGGGGDCGGGE